MTQGNNKRLDYLNSLPSKGIAGIIAHVAHDRYPTMKVIDGTNAVISYLWDRADSAEVGEAFQEFLETMDPDPNEIADFMLTAIIGPRPQKEAPDGQ